MSDMLNERSRIDKIWQDNLKVKEQETTLSDIIKEVTGKSLYKLVKEDSSLPKEPAFADGGDSNKMQGLDPKTKGEPEGEKTIGSKKLEARDDTEPAKPETPLKEDAIPTDMPPVAEVDDEEGEEVPSEEVPIEEPVEEVPSDEEKSTSELISDIQSDLDALRDKIAPEEGEPVEEPIEEPSEVSPEEGPIEEPVVDECSCEEGKCECGKGIAYDEALCKEGMCESQEESITLAEGEFERVEEGAEFTLPKNADVMATYRSKSDPTKRYYVIKPKTGAKEYCTCPAWRFQSKPIDQRTCKHLEDYFAGKQAAVAEKVVTEKYVGFKKLKAKSLNGKDESFNKAPKAGKMASAGGDVMQGLKEKINKGKVASAGGDALKGLKK